VVTGSAMFAEPHIYNEKTKEKEEILCLKILEEEHSEGWYPRHLSCGSDFVF